MIIHYPGGEFTPCGVRFMCPAPYTFHTDACMAGRETCIGIHVTAVAYSINPRIVNCSECIAKVHGGENDDQTHDDGQP